MQLNKPIELFDNQIVEISRQMCYIFFFATAKSSGCNRSVKYIVNPNCDLRLFVSALSLFSNDVRVSPSDSQSSGSTYSTLVLRFLSNKYTGAVSHIRCIRFAPFPLSLVPCGPFGGIVAFATLINSDPSRNNSITKKYIRLVCDLQKPIVDFDTCILKWYTLVVEALAVRLPKPFIIDIIHSATFDHGSILNAANGFDTESNVAFFIGPNNRKAHARRQAVVCFKKGVVL